MHVSYDMYPAHLFLVEIYLCVCVYIRKHVCSASKMIMHDMSICVYVCMGMYVCMGIICTHTYIHTRTCSTAVPLQHVVHKISVCMIAHA
jgi:hypothetical protein